MLQLPSEVCHLIRPVVSEVTSNRITQHQIVPTCRFSSHCYRRLRLLIWFVSCHAFRPFPLPRYRKKSLEKLRPLKLSSTCCGTDIGNSLLHEYHYRSISIPWTILCVFRRITPSDLHRFMVLSTRKYRRSSAIHLPVGSAKCRSIFLWALADFKARLARLSNQPVVLRQHRSNCASQIRQRQQRHQQQPQ